MRPLMPMMVVLIAGSAAMAQPTMRDRPADAVAPPIDRKACAEHNVQGPGDTHETQGRAPAENGLSDKLAQSGGVICPPLGMDPDIRAPAPGGGQTPIIRPPASGEGSEPKPQ